MRKHELLKTNTSTPKITIAKGRTTVKVPLNTIDKMGELFYQVGISISEEYDLLHIDKTLRGFLHLKLDGADIIISSVLNDDKHHPDYCYRLFVSTPFVTPNIISYAKLEKSDEEQRKDNIH